MNVTFDPFVRTSRSTYDRDIKTVYLEGRDVGYIRRIMTFNWIGAPNQTRLVIVGYLVCLGGHPEYTYYTLRTALNAVRSLLDVPRLQAQRREQ